jgi:hypothetical protein
MTTAVMGQTQSPQVDAIRELYFTEGADDMRRRAQSNRSIRVEFFRDGQDESVSVWFVFPSGRAVREGSN